MSSTKVFFSLFTVLVCYVAALPSEASAGVVKLDSGNPNFGEIAVGNESSETFAFTSEDSVKYEPPATITVTEGGASFSIPAMGETNCNGEQSSFERCKIVVKFKPTKKESYKAQLKIFYENSCPHMKESTEITLQGKGK